MQFIHRAIFLVMLFVFCFFSCWDSSCADTIDCTGNEVWCDSAGACVDWLTDNEHCGACDNPCPTIEFCYAGQCSCFVGYSDCHGTCVNLSADAAHCGACDNACGSYEYCANSICEVGSCPYTLCGSECVDTDISNVHCGKCNNPCAIGESCVDGVCLEDNGHQCNDVGGAGECMWDDDCPIDYVCTPGCACMPREGLEGCECTSDGDCATPDHCIMCICQIDFPWCAMNSCLSDEQCSAEGEICVGVGGECAMDERYDYCYCICNP